MAYTTTTLQNPSAQVQIGSVADINDRGHVAGGYLDYANFIAGGFVWDGTYHTFSYNNSTDQIWATHLNNNDQAIGWHTDGVNFLGSFIYSQGTLTPIAGRVTGLNDAGEVVGGSGLGFFYSSGSGIYATVINPWATGFYGASSAVGINDAGDIVGTYTVSDKFSNGVQSTHAYVLTSGMVDATQNHLWSSSTTYALGAFVVENGTGYYSKVDNNVRDPGDGTIGSADAWESIGTVGDWAYFGTITTLTYPGSSSDTEAIAINNADDVLGSYSDSNSVQHYFLYDGGSYSTLNDPSAKAGTTTVGVGLNDFGEVVGTYTDNANHSHTFVYSHGTYTDVGPDGFSPYAINNLGQVLGQNSGSYAYATPLVTTINAGHFGDFDGGTADDVLWRRGDGSVAIWQMNGSVPTGHFLNGAPADWHIVGVGDFDGNGKADILWQNDSGAMLYWTLTNSATFGGSTSLPNAPANGLLGGIGDFDHDGKSDLVWRDASSGAVTVNITDGTSNTIALGTNWSLVGVGDYSGDGKADIMFRDVGAGVNAAWMMNGNTVASAVFYPGVPNDWHVVGSGDFNGDGATDLFWHNNNGANAVWLMNPADNGNILSAGFFDGVGPDWHIAGTGDFNGDHKDDILWRADDGSTAVWQMNGTNTPTVTFPGGVPTDWSSQAHHYDFV